MFYKIINNNKGTTLVEMLIAVSIFSVAMIASTEIYKSVMEGQRSAIAAMDSQESMLYAFDVMSKEIRMAEKDIDVNGDCDDSFPGAARDSWSRGWRTGRWPT